MPVNDADDANRARIDLLVHGVRKPREYDSAELARHHRKAFGVFRNFTDCLVNHGEKVR